MGAVGAWRCATVVGAGAVLALALAAASPGAAAADPVLGLADDGSQITAPVDPDEVLSAGMAHGARFVRLIAYMGSYPGDDRYLLAAQRVAARGLGLDVVLALPAGGAQAGVTAPAFAAWAAQLAARLAATGAPLRVSLLNEPDLVLTAGDTCDPVAAEQIVREAGYVPGRHRVRVTVRQTRIVRRVVRRDGRRRVVRRRLVWKAHRWKVVTTLGSTSASSAIASVSVAQGCLSVRRARRAATFLGAAIPAVRAAAPGIQVGAGETSPFFGLDVFMRELARVGIPPVDRWAHHPYVFVQDGRQLASPPGWFGADRLSEEAGLVHSLFGAGIPLDVTEFGVKHSAVPDPQVRAAIWRAAIASACAAQVRSIVAYQWTPTPIDQGRSWDTSIMGDGLTETPESAQLPTLRC
jgi:hypothetical protein